MRHQKRRTPQQRAWRRRISKRARREGKRTLAAKLRKRATSQKGIDGAQRMKARRLATSLERLAAK